MKRILTLSILCFAAVAMFAQPALKVADTGNVGINQDTPTEKLQISDGNLLVTGTSAFSQQIRAIVDNPRAGFRFESTSNGDFGVFTLRTDFGDAVFSVRDASAGTFNEAFKYDYVNRALNVQGTVASNGTILTSDKKLKKNVSQFERGLETVMELNPISFEYNGKLGTTSGKKHVGVFAQNLQEVAPELVVNQEYHAYNAEMDKTGESGEYLAIKDNEVKWMLVNAIKDQQAIIEKQNERIEALEKAIESLASVETTEIESTLDDGKAASLGLANPNPFNDFTQIEYNIPASAKTAQMRIYGSNGALVNTIEIGNRGKGNVRLEAGNISTGTYTYQLVVDGQPVESKKLIVAN